jgi:hypothetical protein
MNRRGFLGTLFGLAAAPVIVARVLVSPPKPKYKVYRGQGGGLVGYKGTQFINTGYVYAPYIPLNVSDSTNTRK